LPCGEGIDFSDLSVSVLTHFPAKLKVHLMLKRLGLVAENVFGDFCGFTVALETLRKAIAFLAF
jgi:hypothetical protein